MDAVLVNIFNRGEAGRSRIASTASLQRRKNNFIDYYKISSTHRVGIAGEQLPDNNKRELNKQKDRDRKFEALCSNFFMTINQSYRIYT